MISLEKKRSQNKAIIIIIRVDLKQFPSAAVKREKYLNAKNTKLNFEYLKNYIKISLDVLID